MKNITKSKYPYLTLSIFLIFKKIVVILHIKASHKFQYFTCYDGILFFLNHLSHNTSKNHKRIEDNYISLWLWLLLLGQVESSDEDRLAQCPDSDGILFFEGSWMLQEAPVSVSPWFASESFELQTCNCVSVLLFITTYLLQADTRRWLCLLSVPSMCWQSGKKAIEEELCLHPASHKSFACSAPGKCICFIRPCWVANGAHVKKY